MDRELYDIFISYRRDGGFETAKHLYDLLSNDGYTVSFDIDTLREGDFDSTLLRRVDQCTDFILVVDKHAFDRTLDEDFDPQKDWLRIELAYALKMRKNVITVMLSGVTEFPKNLPEDIKSVGTKNGPEYNKYYFDEFYKRLKSFLHCLPRNLDHTNKSVAFVTIQAKKNYRVTIDGSNICILKAGEFKKIEVGLGEHVFIFSPIDTSEKNIVIRKEFPSPQNYVLNVSAHNPKKSLYLFGILLFICITTLLLSRMCKDDHVDNPSGKADTVESDATHTINVKEVEYHSEYIGTYFYSGPLDSEQNPHGIGSAKFGNGDIYQGEFFHGKIEGKGKYAYSDGSVFEGDFLNNECWNGCYTEKDGSKTIYENGKYK